MKFVFTLAVAVLTLGTMLSANEIPVKNGDKIAFLGDSITQGGNSKPGGFIHLVIDGLKRAGVEAVPLCAGFSGYKSNGMLARVDKAVIEKKPQWMLLSCGVNDVWHGANGVPLEDYKKNITALCDKVEKAGIKIMILTATMIQEDPAHKLNQQLAPYNEFLRQFAKERNYLLADLNDRMQKSVAQKTTRGNKLTSDGVHMNPKGNQMMAEGILLAFGVPAEKVAGYPAIWDDFPNTSGTHFWVMFSVNEWKKITAEAAARKTNPRQMLLDMLKKQVKEEILNK